MIKQHNEIAAEFCRVDFWLMMEKALKEASGRFDCLGEISYSNYAEMKLYQVVDVLAQNGIRMVYMPERTPQKIKEELKGLVKND